MKHSKSITCRPRSTFRPARFRKSGISFPHGATFQQPLTRLTHACPFQRVPQKGNRSEALGHDDRIDCSQTSSQSFASVATDGALETYPDKRAAGKRLRRRVQLKETPTIGDLSRAYTNAGEAEWPHSKRWRRVRENGSGRFVWSGAGAKFAKQWWRCILCTLYFTALRRSDILTLKWSDVSADRISRTMQKSGFESSCPCTPVLRSTWPRCPGPRNTCSDDSARKSRSENRCGE